MRLRFVQIVRELDPIPFEVNLLRTVIVDTFAGRPCRLSLTTTADYPAVAEATVRLAPKPARQQSLKFR
jgi:hypothetical protein